MSEIDYKKMPLNAIPSVQDERDFTIVSITAEDDTPNYETDISNIPVENQGYVGGCVSESGICTLAISRKVQRHENPLHFSRSMLYANRYSTDNQTSGLIPRQCWEHLLKEGVCLGNDFTDWEEVPAIINAFNAVKNVLMPKAINYKIKAYYKLNTTEEIKAAIKKYGAISICIPVYEHFYDTPYNNDIVPMPQFLEGIKGFHEMLLYGWKDNKYFLCRNSWGEDWTPDMKGSCLLPFEFPISEAWAFDVSEDNPQPKPQPTTLYRVQTGCFLIKSNADKLATEIRNKGIATCLMKYGLFYKVMCGSFLSKDNAIKMRDKLISIGYKGAFIQTITK